MLAKCIKWRIESKVIDLVEKGDLGLSKIDDKYLEQGKANKTFAAGMTDNLIPIVYIHVSRHLAKAQGAETMTRFVIASAESFRCLMSYPNDKIVIVFDLSGFGMKNMDWHSLTTIMQILEAYYPETLSKLYIHNAPWIFQGIWKAISPMLDPAVRAKIDFTSKPADLDLVPSNRLEKRLGGELAEEVPFVPPQPNENKTRPRGDPERQRLWDAYLSQAKVYEDLTKKWDKSHGSDKKLEDERDFQALKLRLAWMDLDPIIRGRTTYHRSGIITPDFTFHWTYKQASGKTITHDVGKERSRSALQKRIAEREGTGNGSAQQSEQNQQSQQSQQTQQSQQGQEQSASAPEQSDNAATGAAAGTAAGVAGLGAGAAGFAAASGKNKGVDETAAQNYESAQPTYAQNYAQQDSGAYEQQDASAYAHQDASAYAHQDASAYAQQDPNAYAQGASQYAQPDQAAHGAPAQDYSQSAYYTQGYPAEAYNTGYDQSAAYQTGAQADPSYYSNYATSAAAGIGAGAVGGVGAAVLANNVPINEEQVPPTNSLAYLQTYVASNDIGTNNVAPASVPASAPSMTRSETAVSGPTQSLYTNSSTPNQSSEDLFFDANGPSMDGNAESVAHYNQQQEETTRGADAYGAEQEETDPYGADAYHSGDYAEQQPQEHAHDGSAAEGYDLTHGANVQLEDGVPAGDDNEKAAAQGAQKDFDEQIAEGGMTEAGSKIGKEKSPLAGFPYLANGSGPEAIAEANLRARKEAEQVAQKGKGGFLSKLNCCSAKNID